MITKPPKTAKGYYRYHKILWNAIIRLIREHKRKKQWLFSSQIKEIAFNKTFSFEIEVYCFPCVWSIENGSVDCSYSCLLKCKNYSSNIYKCLDGVYQRFQNATWEDNYNEAIKLASKIRDMPMKKKWL